MTLRSLAARGLSFAHLAGIGSARAEDDKDEDKKAKAKAKAKAEDEKDDDESQNRDDGDAKADDDEDDAKAEDDDQKDDEPKSKKAKAKAKAKSEEDEDDEDEDAEDDDDEEEMRGNSVASRARRREQARCASIMSSRAAGRNVVLAANLAFTTRMTRTEALAILDATPAASVAGQGRAARNPSLGAGGDLSGNSKAAASAGWDRAFSKQARTARR